MRQIGIPNRTKVKLIDIDRWNMLPGVLLTEQANNFMTIDVHYVLGNSHNPLYRITNGEYSFWVYPKEIDILSNKVKVGQSYVAINLDMEGEPELVCIADSEKEAVEKIQEYYEKEYDVPINFLLAKEVSVFHLETKKSTIMKKLE